MLTYVVRRLLFAVPVFAGILVFSFVLVRRMPGDPVRAMMNPEQPASPEYVARRRAELGLDDPVVVQLLAWYREVLRGNLGYSFRQKVPVTEVIGERVGATILVALTALGAAVVIGVAIGVVAALKQNSWFDYVSSVVSMAAISVPNFFLGLVVIYVFSIRLGVLPSGGMRNLSDAETSFIDLLRHLVLPAGVLAANLVGPYVRYTRQSMLEILPQDYMTTARAKGVPGRAVVLRHGLRNGLIPLTTVIALQIPGLLTGVLIIEVVFSWPGLGRLAYEAIRMRDYPVIMGFVFLSAVLVLVFNLIADVLAAMLDPRIRV